jgi:hypothetical protein
MFKRLFFAMVGLGGGLALGVYAVRKIEATQRALAPDQVAGAIGRRVTAALDAGRAAMAAKEAELRAEHGIPDPEERWGHQPGPLPLPPD